MVYSIHVLNIMSECIEIIKVLFTSNKIDNHSELTTAD